MDLHITNKIILETNPKIRAPLNETRVGIDPYKQTHIDAMFTEGIHLPFYLEPHTRALLSTVEMTVMKEGHCGLIGLRSTWARLGLISPLTIVDPGFRGNLTMEVYNASDFALLIRPNDRIWNMTIVKTDEPVYKGKYMDQVGIQKPIAFKEER